MRILIADDHPVVRQGVRQIIESEPGFMVAAEATNGDEALTLVRQVEWDLAVLDYGRALACDPTYRNAAYNRSVVLARLGRLEEARADYVVFRRLGGRPSAALAALLGEESAINAPRSSVEQVVPDDAP